MSDPVKIYFLGPMDRSGRVRWLLEEMGVSYEDKTLDYQTQAHKKPEFLKINPMGAVPAVECDGQILIESAAICAYFADKHADKGMAPALDAASRGKYLQWMFFSIGTLEPIVTEGFKAKGSSEEEQKKAVELMAEKFKPAFQMLTDALDGKEYLVDGKFSAADIMIGTTLHWAKQFNLVEDGSALSDYVERLKAREAAKKVGVFLPIPF